VGFDFSPSQPLKLSRLGLALAREPLQRLSPGGEGSGEAGWASARLDWHRRGWVGISISQKTPGTFLWQGLSHPCPLATASAWSESPVTAPGNLLWLLVGGKGLGTLSQLPEKELGVVLCFVLQTLLASRCVKLRVGSCAWNSLSPCSASPVGA